MEHKKVKVAPTLFCLAFFKGCWNIWTVIYLLSFNVLKSFERKNKKKIFSCNLFTFMTFLFGYFNHFSTVAHFVGCPILNFSIFALQSTSLYTIVQDIYLHSCVSRLSFEHFLFYFANEIQITLVLLLANKELLGIINNQHKIMVVVEF